jgi:hypothetical protein
MRAIELWVARWLKTGELAGAGHRERAAKQDSVLFRDTALRWYKSFPGTRNLARIPPSRYYRRCKRNLEKRDSSKAQEKVMVPEVIHHQSFEISPRFRRSMEERIARLEQGANYDEAQLPLLVDQDHVRRQLRLAAVQREEALRMRLFLDRAGTRLPRPMIPIDQKNFSQDIS